MSERPRWFKPAVAAAAGMAALLVARHFADSGSDDLVVAAPRPAGAPALPSSSGSAAGSAAGSAISPALAAVTAPPLPAQSSRAPDSTSQAPAPPELPTRTPITGSSSKDPFAARGWLPPPPPPPPPAALPPPPPPPPPQAPPVPFRFVGLIEEKSAKPAAFIAKGDALFVVHVGDVVDTNYRVESFNSAQVVVTYLPLKQRQTIEVTGG